MPPIVMDIEIPAGLEDFRLPEGGPRRLQDLLDRQELARRARDGDREALAELGERFARKIRARMEGDQAAEPSGSRG